RDALVVSAFEICHLSTPHAVAVNEGVELVRGISPRAAGLANAVLRRIASSRAPMIQAAVDACGKGKATAEQFALVSELPLWFAERVLDSLGQEDACAYCLCVLDAAPVHVSPVVTDVLRGYSMQELGTMLSERLSSEGIASEAADLPGVLRLAGSSGLAASDPMRGSLAVVSDLSAQTIARCVCPREGASLLEVGQGVGTKALVIASYARTLGYEARIEGVELSPKKVATAHERLSAAGFDRTVESVCMDAMRLDDAAACAEKGISGTFDTVFVDAPCSGSGTLRRHPEIAGRLDEGALDPRRGLPATQFSMLMSASEKVGVGGLLAYSTCSLFHEENEDVVERFLSSSKGRLFRRVGADSSSAAMRDPELASAIREHMDVDGSFNPHPVRGGADGHYLVLLERAQKLQ
ncbi:MAG: RsmB/NOP family class I SAM-dependent RNA methyltransferase, partial [Atopobiaceae bacterium]|nr:RsmB/NOP family class I SAM-dependent RNA methyltransferase [Atopobiaceae bacterium]